MIYGQPHPPGITGLRKHVHAHPRSPLLVRYAHALVDAGEYQAAVELCRPALEMYPGYATLHLVLAKAQIALRQFGSARKRLQDLAAGHPACLAATGLLQRIERMERQSLLQGGKDDKGIPDAELSYPEPPGRQKKMNWSWREHLIPGEDAILDKRARDFMFTETTPAGVEELPTADDSPVTDEIAEDDLLAARFQENTNADELPGDLFSASDFDFSFPEGLEITEGTDLEKLADELDSASMPRLSGSDEDDEHAPEFGAVNLESRPVTETLAEIYVKQGKLAEAIDAYRKLRDTNRDKRYAYTVRISEIKRLIDERPQGRA